MSDLGELILIGERKLNIGFTHPEGQVEVNSSLHMKRYAVYPSFFTKNIKNTHFSKKKSFKKSYHKN